MKKYLTFLITTLLISTSLAQEQKISFLFAGDAMQHKSQLDVAKTPEGYDYSAYFKHVADEIKRADIAVVNMEVTLPGINYTGYPRFGSPDEYAFALKEAGFDIFLIANNHILDKGKKGLERTITILDSMKVKHTGAFINAEKRDLYYPLMMIKNGIRIAMINYTYDTNGYTVTKPNIVNYIDKKQILRDIDAAKTMKADIIIANMHWGIEYVLKQNKEQEDLANFLIKNGVHLVIGGHPHVVQPIDIRKENEEIKNIVVYSMGNLISGMKPVNTTGGMIVKIDISKNGDQPIKIDSLSYSLVWVNKLIKDKDTPSFFELLPVAEFNNEKGKEKLGEESFVKMQTFATNAKNAIESLWRKEE
ncbi:CapA family protein [Dysgonomonas sp. Marseille-P4677]|uniref:CapA family protein n=1 Tax=Dysgonomonas sp. Marseille-P4677 TaxID=2364790 RepID=UPI0019147D76|nr:CapA family protein [Dysgonomonas sp. Marseille-P4677]MBK5719624.1 CapA family protein [Dysgonomonas sp. Marseille-P4677]